MFIFWETYSRPVKIHAAKIFHSSSVMRHLIVVQAENNLPSAVLEGLGFKNLKWLAKFEQLKVGAPLISCVLSGSSLQQHGRPLWLQVILGIDVY